MYLALSQISSSFCRIHNDFGSSHSALRGPFPAEFIRRFLSPLHFSRISLVCLADLASVVYQKHEDLVCVSRVLKEYHIRKVKKI